MDCIIVTGMSGAGKTQALHALEDLGVYCVDNLPPSLIPNLIDLLKQGKSIDRVAIGADIRSRAMFADLEATLNFLDTQDIHVEILFLEASGEELVRRYQETRRSHPMGADKRLPDSIAQEKEMLSPLRLRATEIIDTTQLRSTQLIALLTRLYGENDTPQEDIMVHVVSFGFKQGILQEADMILDVRFLQNPFYVPSLRLLTGRDQAVKDYIFSFPESQIFVDKTISLLTFLLPEYSKEGKRQFILGVGCTGGQHRSITLAISLGEELEKAGYHVRVSHRDH
ncbi:MAG: RNase adapter RapZ [Clostridia bacterium]|nr:RNase adapter RapZ [Clostridia bacterium]